MMLSLIQMGVSEESIEGRRIFSPVGLVIGAETAEEIALSVASEIMAVMSGKGGDHLKNEFRPIHSGSSDISQV